MSIDWDEYKEYKVYNQREDRLEMLIGFIRSYYNISNPRDIYDLLANDDVGELMLKKREIHDVEALESYVFHI